MKRHKTGMSDLEAIWDIVKTYRWPALFLGIAAGMVAELRMALKRD